MHSSIDADRNEVDPVPAGGGMAPRSALRQQRSRTRQEALLDAAEKIISEVGLDGLAMREIGRRSGVPIASVYHYFPSAAAMVRALAARQLARVSELVRSMVDQEIGGADLSGTELGAHAESVIVAVATYLETMPAAPAIWNALRSNPDCAR